MLKQKKDFFCAVLNAVKNLNLATKITLLRIVIIIPVLMLLSSATKFACFLACLLFVIAALSDFIDGYIARNYGQVTSLGKFLDPLADKFLICTVLIELCSLGWIPAWAVHIIIVRELAVTGLRAVAVDYGIVLAADTFGKWKTTFQILACIPLMLHYTYLGINLHQIGIILLYAAVFFTILSGCNYFYRFCLDIHDKEV